VDSRAYLLIQSAEIPYQRSQTEVRRLREDEFSGIRLSQKRTPGFCGETGSDNAKYYDHQRPIAGRDLREGSEKHGGGL
jgi:hypothetical protein